MKWQFWPGQCRVLVSLGDELVGGMRWAELAGLVDMAEKSVGNVLKQLVKMGLVVGTVTKGPRHRSRAVCVVGMPMTLTPTGRAVVAVLVARGLLRPEFGSGSVEVEV